MTGPSRARGCTAGRASRRGWRLGSNAGLPRIGRPADTGRFGPEMAALLRHGESVAGRIGHRYVEAAHLWHAVASGRGRAWALCGADVDGAGPRPSSTRRSTFIDPALDPRHSVATDDASATAAPRSRGPVGEVRRESERRRDRFPPGLHRRTAGPAWNQQPPDLVRRATRSRCGGTSTPTRGGGQSVRRRASRSERCHFPSAVQPGARGADRPAWSNSCRTHSGMIHGSGIPGAAPSPAIERVATSSSTAGSGSSTSMPTATTFAPQTGGRSAIDIAYFTKVPKRLPGRPKTEALPMPPFPILDWPDRRYVPED